MPIVQALLRADDRFREVFAEANAELCEHRLAKVAHDIELNQGRVKLDRFKFGDRLTYKYHAATPLALKVHGRRWVPMKAWATWGASTTLSFVRHDASQPIGHLWVNLTRLTKIVDHSPSDVARTLFFGTLVGGLSNGTLGLVERAYLALRAMTDRVPLGPWGPAIKSGLTVYTAAHVLGLAEMLAGAYHECDAGVHPPILAQHQPFTQRLRQNGLLYGLRYLVESIDVSQPSTIFDIARKTVAIELAAALLVADVAVAGARLGMLTAMTAVALSGALLGVTLGFYAGFRAPGVHESVRLYNVLFDRHGVPYAFNYDNREPAAIHREEAMMHRRAPYWFEPRELPRDLEAEFQQFGRDANRPQEAPVQQIEPEVPLAHVDNGELTRDVHGLGRDAATRRSVAALLRRYPAPDIYDAAWSSGLWMKRQGKLENWRIMEDEGTSKFNVFERAVVALTSEDFGSANNTIAIEHGFGVQHVVRVYATVWHAIDQLQAVEDTPEANEALQIDRRRAFARALAECLPGGLNLVCAPGQTQRLLMVLQGFLPDVQIERYDAPAPVNQFLNQQLAYLAREIGGQEDPDEQLVRRHLDQAYMAGRALYVGENLKDLTHQLTEFARLYDIDAWQPAA